MGILRTYGQLSVLVLFIAFVPSCSDPRSASQFNSDTGQHAAGWLPAGHAASVDASGSAGCSECHGADLAGGIASVSCTSCHLGGPLAVHPTSWSLLYRDHGPYTDTNGTGGCANQYCHGSSLQGVTDSGPSCTSCHSIPYDPATLICSACHRIPPDGTSFPNVAGRHNIHATSDTTTCSICHNGAGGMTTNSYHMNNVADVFFLSAYNAKSGAASYNASANTCSNVSCHGGQTTPSWLTGSINVNTQCTSCHASGTSQYNSYHSGQHTKHVVQEGKACTECHDTTKLAVSHFTSLSTTTMEGPASGTLLNSLNYAPGGTPGTGSCRPPCHGSESW